MKILHVYSWYLPARSGGPIWSIHGLCRRLVERGHEVDVFTTNRCGKRKLDVPIGEAVSVDGVNVHYFPSERLQRISYSPGILSTLKTTVHKYDIIHVHGMYQWPAMVAARAALNYGCPYVISPRGMLIPELINQHNRLIKSLWIRFIELRYLEGAAFVHFTTLAEQHGFRALNLPSKNAIVIPNGIEKSGLLPKKNTAGCNVLYLGRLSSEKGLPLLLSSLTHAPQARLVVAGTGDGNTQFKLEQKIRALGLEGRVEFVGFVEGDQKQRLIASADILALTSVAESFGNVVLEAWAQGRPVLVTEGVGLGEAVIACGGGIVCPHSSEQIGSTLDKALCNPTMLDKMGAAGYASLQSNFSWSGIARRMELSYLQAIDEQMRVSKNGA